jgi:chromate transporter
LRVGCGPIFLLFAQVSLVSIGGGTVAWMRHLAVNRRHWLSEGEFAEALAICQLLPGANAVNLSVFLGSEWAGKRGALAALLGLTLFPLLLVCALGMLYAHVGHNPTAQRVFSGLAAGAAGVGAGTGLAMARKNLKERQAVGLMLLLWLALVWAHWPLWMLALATPLLVRLLYGAKG